MASIGSMRGYKDTFGPMKIMAISYWGVGLPLGIILSITDIIDANGCSWNVDRHGDRTFSCSGTNGQKSKKNIYSVYK